MHSLWFCTILRLFIKFEDDIEGVLGAGKVHSICRLERFIRLAFSKIILMGSL
jgi:hypothetical protein